MRPKLREWVSRLVGTFWPGRTDHDLEEELRHHLDLAAEESSDARPQHPQARPAGLPQALDALRDQRVLPWLDDFVLDLRHAGRLLRRSPLLTAVAVISLAFGIGANTAAFSLADELLLRPLPVRDPNRIVTVVADRANEESTGGRLSYPNYLDLANLSHTLDGLVAYRWQTISFARSREAARDVRFAMLVSDNFFHVLGVDPTLGRAFSPLEGKVSGREAVVVLSHDFWTSVFGEDQTALGSTVWINNIDVRVIGIAPPEFTGIVTPTRPAMYLPVSIVDRLTATQGSLDDRAALTFRVKGRLKPGISPRAARVDLATIWRGLARQYPDVNHDRLVAVRSEMDDRFQTDRTDAIFMALLVALAILVLIIACANVANLMLGRARARAREMAIRGALGVSRFRLLRQLLTESLLLAGLAVLPALGLAYIGIRFFQTIPVVDPVVFAPHLDHRVLAVSLTAALGSAFICGIAPAFHSIRTALVPALKGFASEETPSRSLGRRSLVVLQVALSMVLLIASGMLIDGFRKLLVLDPGYRTDDLMVMSTNTGVLRSTPEQSRQFYEQLADRTRALPGVESVALASSLPLANQQSTRGVIPEGYVLPPGQGNVSLYAAAVTEGYFSTMKIDILRGRAFTSGDRADTRRVAVVNEEFVKRYWPDQNPIGKRLQLDDRSSGYPWLEVVGVVRTARYLFISEPPTPFIYMPFAQDSQAQMWLVVKTTTVDPASLAAPMRDAVRKLNVEQPISTLRTFGSLYEERAIQTPRIVMELVGALGSMGLILALVGLYAVVVHAVERRTREIGIRMAIGATKHQVLRMVLGQGVTLSLLGIAVGVSLTLVVSRLLSAGMVGLGTATVSTFVATPILLVGLASAASYIPACRAARINPVDALRCE